MDSSLSIIERLVVRLTGPMHFRFILQPLMAILLGIRDGVHDAKVGTPPFIWDLLSNPKGRKRQFQRALRSLAFPIIVAAILDGVVQYLLFREVRLLGAVLFGVTIMGLPYAFARALTNRIVSSRTHPPLPTCTWNR